MPPITILPDPSDLAARASSLRWRRGAERRPHRQQVHAVPEGIQRLREAFAALPEESLAVNDDGSSNLPFTFDMMLAMASVGFGNSRDRAVVVLQIPKGWVLDAFLADPRLQAAQAAGHVELTITPSDGDGIHCTIQRQLLG